MTEDIFQLRVLVDANEQDIRHAYRRGRPIVLPICANVGTASFPNNDWSDFAIVVLTWWANEIAELIRGNKQLAVITFMDGPYELEISPNGRGLWSIQGVTRRIERKTKQFLGRVKLEPTVEQFLGTATHLLHAMRAADIWDSDCDALDAALRSLSEEFANWKAPTDRD